MLCNTSMGTMNMSDFIQTYGFKNENQFTFTEDSKIGDIINLLDKNTKKKFITILYENKIELSISKINLIFQIGLLKNK